MITIIALAVRHSLADLGPKGCQMRVFIKSNNQVHILLGIRDAEKDGVK